MLKLCSVLCYSGIVFLLDKGVLLKQINRFYKQFTYQNLHFSNFSIACFLNPATMQKILFRPICHMSHEQANAIFEEIRFTTPYHQMYQGGSHIQKDFQPSSYSGSMLANNNFVQHNNNQHEKVGGQNLRANRFNSLPENPQFVQQNQQKNQNFPILGTNQNYPSSNQQKNSQNGISKDSIMRKYDDFFGEKVNDESLKEQNSRLYYEKLALEASVQRLKEQAIKKDRQIQRLKQVIDNGVMNQQRGPNNFHTSAVNPPQIHFRSNFQPKRGF